MNLVRFQNPRYNVNRNLVDELFNSFLKNDYHENYLQNCGNQPATNVFETEKDFRIEIVASGFSKRRCENELPQKFVDHQSGKRRSKG